MSTQEKHRTFESGSIRDNDDHKPLVNHLDAYTRLRFGFLLLIGGKKYGKNNWRKGQPTEAGLESLHRHLALYELGDRSEDHLSAIIFNAQLMMKNEEKDGVEYDAYYKKWLDKKESEELKKSIPFAGYGIGVCNTANAVTFKTIDGTSYTYLNGTTNNTSEIKKKKS